MRNMSNVMLALMVAMISSCGGGGPSAQDIDNSLDATLRSVVGAWTGSSNPPNAIHLEFQLQEGSNGQVSGTGTMKEDNAPAAVPITVSGTFQRPVLTLAFDGIVYESHAVKAVAQASYTTVGGIATSLQLTAPGYSRDVPILLQEK
jgi:hypothetical protein